MDWLRGKPNIVNIYFHLLSLCAPQLLVLRIKLKHLEGVSLFLLPELRIKSSKCVSSERRRRTSKMKQELNSLSPPFVCEIWAISFLELIQPCDVA